MGRLRKKRSSSLVRGCLVAGCAAIRDSSTGGEPACALWRIASRPDREVSSDYASEDAAGTYTVHIGQACDDQHYRFVTAEQDVGADGALDTTWAYI